MSGGLRACREELELVKQKYERRMREYNDDWRKNREELARVRGALGRSDSYLSLLRHRCERSIKWGTPGLPTIADVDEVIGQSRAALTGPAREEGT